MPSEHSNGVEPLQDRMSSLVVILVVAMVATPLVLRGIGILVGPALSDRMVVGLGLLTQQAVLLAATLFRLRHLGIRWSDLNPYVESVAQAGRAFMWGIALLFLNGLTAQIALVLFTWVLGEGAVNNLLQQEQAAVMRLIDPASGTLLLGFTVFLAVGVAPVVEEVFFRGYAFRVLKYHTGVHAIWLSALLFAGVHLYVINFVPVFVLGVILARIYDKTRSLAVPIVAHATVNGLVAIVAVLSKSLT